MGDPSGSNGSTELGLLLEETAATLGGVLARTDSSGLTWTVDGQPIASLAGGTALFRIGREIGAAALKTPDTSASTLGPEWVGFRPATLDDHARDRAVAWFGAAHRRADQT